LIGDINVSLEFNVIAKECLQSIVYNSAPAVYDRFADTTQFMVPNVDLLAATQTLVSLTSISKTSCFR